MYACYSTVQYDVVHSYQAHSLKVLERQEDQRRRERSREPAAEAVNSCQSLTGNKTEVIHICKYA